MGYNIELAEWVYCIALSNKLSYSLCYSSLIYLIQFSFLKLSLLRTALPFATAHVFCASHDGLKNSDFLRTKATQFKGIFAQFMTMQEKKILVRAIEIQKANNWG